MLKAHILNRLKELYPSNVGFGFKNSSVIKDAQERGFKIDAGQISRYFNDKPDQQNKLSENQVLWIAIRYGIDIKLSVSSNKFNEADSLKKLKLIFG